MIQPVIQPLAAEGHAEHTLVPVQSIASVGELPCLKQIQIGVRAQLRMHAQVFYAAFAEHGAYGIGQAADPQLQAGPVLDVRHDTGGDLFLHFRGLGDGQFINGRVFPFHNIVCIGDMDHFVKPAADPGQMLVYLQDHNIRLAQDPPCHPGGAGKIEISVLIHGRNADHSHVHC